MAIMTIGFNPAIDRILECPDFHIGGHQQAKQIARLAAGKAANVNRALAQLSTDSIATGFVGEGDMDFFHEQLMSAGPGRILCRFVEVGSRTRENISILDPHRRLETHLRDRGLAVTAEEAKLLEQKIMHELKAGDVAVFAGSLCEGLDAEFFASLLDQCVARGAKVVVDSSGDPLKTAGGHRVWLLKPNLEELRQLVGVEVPNAASAVREAASPLLKNVQNVLVTRGPMGAVLLTGGGAWSARLATKDVPVRTVGCGDHLLAGFVAEMTAGQGEEAALVKAVAVATARAMSSRMEEFDVDIMNRTMGNVVVERI
jgi:1-phosphofructokinase family hexose kinase